MKTLIKYLTLAASLAAFAVSARAVPTLILYDWITATLVIVQDENFAPALPATNADQWAGANVVTYSGSVGEWSVNVSTGISSGSNVSPVLHLNSVNFVATGSATDYHQLSVGFSADGFGPTPATGVTSNFGGTTGSGGTVYYSVWADPTNSGYPGSGILIPPGWAGAYGPGAFSGSNSGPIGPLAAFYSISMVVEIDQVGRGVTSYDLDIAVPDSSTTALLLGLGLLGVGVASRRRNA